MDDLMSVILIVSLTINLVQSFFVYRSIDTDKARQLFETMGTAASKTPNELDDALVDGLKQFMAWYNQPQPPPNGSGFDPDHLQMRP